MLSYKLVLHKDAQTDLSYIWRDDPNAAADISVFLEELENNDEMRRELASTPNQQDAFDAKHFAYMKDNGHDVRRIKFWDDFGRVNPYRLLFGFDDDRHLIVVLWVMKRELGKDYENDKQTIQRVRTACAQHGI